MRKDDMIYLSAKDIADRYSVSVKTARTIIAEIRSQISAGRYPEMSILDGCGVRVRADVVTDYIYYRRALKDPVAAKYVEGWKNDN